MGNPTPTLSNDQVQDAPAESVATPKTPPDPIAGDGVVGGVATNDEAEVSSTAYPTDQAVRQKEALKKKKQELADQGWTKEEIKQATKRKAQAQEKHFDDCGSNVDPLEEKEVRVLLARFHGTLDDAVAYSFFEDPEASQIEDDFEDMLRDGSFSLSSALELMMKSVCSQVFPWMFHFALCHATHVA